MPDPILLAALAAITFVGFMLARRVARAIIQWLDTPSVSQPGLWKMTEKLHRDLAKIDQGLAALAVQQAAIDRVEWAYSRIGRFKDVQPPVRNS